METPELCIVYIHSNYDCTNSFDTFESSQYLQEVYKTVSMCIPKNDFMYEHENGAYGGSLFCFAFQSTEHEIELLKESFEEKIFIPANTQFGFHSPLQGAASIFEKVTQRDMWLPRVHGETEHDFIRITYDGEMGYSLDEIFGGADFFEEQKEIAVL